MAITAETLRFTNDNWGRKAGWKPDLDHLQRAEYEVIDSIHGWFKLYEQGWVQYAVKVDGNADEGWSQASLVLYSHYRDRVPTFETGSLFWRKPHLILAETLNEYAPRVLEDTSATVNWQNRYLRLDPDDCTLDLPYLPVRDITIRPFIGKWHHVEFYRSGVAIRAQVTEEIPNQVVVVVTAGIAQGGIKSGELWFGTV